MISKYHYTASKSGARLVFSCGFDSVPFDLGVQYVQNAAVEKWGEPAGRVRCRVRAMNGEFSGGTAASFRATVKSLETRLSFSMCLSIHSVWLVKLAQNNR